MSLRERFFIGCIKADKIEKARQFLKLDKNLVNVCDANGNTGLHLVQSVEMLDLLLDNGANINARNKLGEIPLFDAKTPAIAKRMLEKGADVTAKNFNSDTVLIKYARRVNNQIPVMTVSDFLEIWPMLKLANVNPCLRNKDGRIARDYLNIYDNEQTKIAIRLSHQEMAVRCSKKSDVSKSNQGK